MSEKQTHENLSKARTPLEKLILATKVSGGIAVAGFLGGHFLDTHGKYGPKPQEHPVTITNVGRIDAFETRTIGGKTIGVHIPVAENK